MKIHIISIYISSFIYTLTTTGVQVITCRIDRFITMVKFTSSTYYHISTYCAGSMAFDFELDFRQILLAAMIFLVSLTIFKWRRLSTSLPVGARFPPCMVSLPIVGSMPFIDANRLHKSLMEQAAKYGNIFTISLGSK